MAGSARALHQLVQVLVCVFCVFGGAALAGSVAHGDGLASQENALVAFKQGLEHPEALESWNPQLDRACSGKWRGVTCNAAHNAVTGLTLEGEDFTGIIPNDIRQMKFLSSLTIRKTAFMGAIPQAIADLRNLKNLIIAANPQLNGTFPSWILDLKSLEKLSLAGNNLTGSLPGISPNQGPPCPNVSVSIPVPIITLVNFTVPNVPVVMFTPANATVAPVVVPVLWFSKSPAIDGKGDTYIGTLAFLCPNGTLPSPANVTFHTSNWTIPSYPKAPTEVPLPELSPPFASFPNYTLPLMPYMNGSDFLFDLACNCTPTFMFWPSWALPWYNFTNPFAGHKPPPLPGVPPCDENKQDKPQDKPQVKPQENTNKNDNNRLLLDSTHSELAQLNEGVINGLPNLKFLDLSNNAFTGKVSNDLHGLLPNLKHVDLSNNMLEGNVPRTLFKSKVKSINLANNYFSGRLPHMRINKFDHLDVSSNCLVGIVPKRVGKSSSEFSYAQKCPTASKHCKCAPHRTL